MKNQDISVKGKVIKLLSLFVTLLIFSNCSNKKTETAIYTKHKTKYSYTVEQFNLPSDWSKAEYVELEMKISSPERIKLILTTVNGPTGIDVMPAANAWIRIDIPLKFYRKANTEGSEMAALYSRSRTTGWYNIWAVRIDSLNKVDSISFKIKSPTPEVKLEIRSVKLSDEVHEEFIEPKLLVDKFGQWIPANWDGKIKNIEELKNAWKNDDDLLTKQGYPDRDKFGGFNNTKQKATGYFYCKKIDGKWWFVDPLGNLFLATGVNGVSPGDYTRTKNRKYIFEQIPPEEFQSATDDPNAPLVSYGRWNQERRFGKNWQEEWKKLAVKRMKTWGLNAINWSVPYLNDTVVYAKFLEGWGIEEGVMGMPDVYSQAFVDRVDSVARTQCEPLKNDPWLLGYFIGNEPVWPGMESLVVDAILQGKDTEMKSVLKSYLKKGDTPERRKEFIHDSFIRFLSIINSAIKKYDPNHLTLGIRFGGDLNMEDKVIKMAEIFDVFSFNAYLKEVPKDKLDRVARIMDKPILIGEFHFGVAGRGLDGGLQQVKDQQARGLAYSHYVENAMAHPNVVATFWYRWRDQPNTGRSDGENYNIGLVDVTGLSYKEITAAVRKTNSRVKDIHAGKVKPID